MRQEGGRVPPETVTASTALGTHLDGLSTRTSRRGMGPTYDKWSERPAFEAGGSTPKASPATSGSRAPGRLRRRQGLVSVLGQPFKCPRPFEGAFLLHEYFHSARHPRLGANYVDDFPEQAPVTAVSGDGVGDVPLRR